MDRIGKHNGEGGRAEGAQQVFIVAAMAGGALLVSHDASICLRASSHARLVVREQGGAWKLPTLVIGSNHPPRAENPQPPGEQPRCDGSQRLRARILRMDTILELCQVDAEMAHRFTRMHGMRCFLRYWVQLPILSILPSWSRSGSRLRWQANPPTSRPG